MKTLAALLPGVRILTPDVYEDSRGWFAETWNERRLRDLGIDCRFVQDNESYSKRGVLRGLHFQKGNSVQAKLVRVIQGRILDVVLDIRAGSPTFGRHAATELSDENHRQIFIPKGFAHGFVTLSESALTAYKCDAHYAPGMEGSIRALDPALGINWAMNSEDLILSGKDASAPSWADYCRTPAFFYSEDES